MAGASKISGSTNDGSRGLITSPRLRGEVGICANAHVVRGNFAALGRMHPTRRYIFSSPWPGLSRPSTAFCRATECAAKTWVAGTSPAMGDRALYRIRYTQLASLYRTALPACADAG